MEQLASLHPYPRVSVEETLTAAPGIVDLWCYFYDQNRDEALSEAQTALMSAEEVARLNNFRFEDDRRMFLAAHALVRCTLSAYCDVPPADWRFTVGPHGKPCIQAPVIATPLNFNLAHTRGLAVCAVSVAHGLVGVDVECADGRHTDALALRPVFLGVGSERFEACVGVGTGPPLPPAMDVEGKLREGERLGAHGAPRSILLHRRRERRSDRLRIATRCGAGSVALHDLSTPRRTMSEPPSLVRKDRRHGIRRSGSSSPDPLLDAAPR